MRLLEGLRLRVQDLDFGKNASGVTIRMKAVCRKPSASTAG
jgi:hypothetical protein